jgi:hypothetical protein
MGIAEDFQCLADSYETAIKRIRIIRKRGKEDLIILPHQGRQTQPPLLGFYQRDFDAMTVKHAAEIQEVRVILNNATGSSQFFPPGTPEDVVWGSTVTKEELEA